MIKVYPHVPLTETRGWVLRNQRIKSLLICYRQQRRYLISPAGRLFHPPVDLK